MITNLRRRALVMEKKAPGKGFLKGVGILLIIGGVFGCGL